MEWGCRNYISIVIGIDLFILKQLNSSRNTNFQPYDMQNIWLIVIRSFRRNEVYFVHLATVGFC